MTLWKRNSPRKEAPKSSEAPNSDAAPKSCEAPKSKESPDLYRELKKEIVVMRKQGVPPAKDPGSFAKYLCDLCNSPHPVSGLRQCVLCGRWACDTCWKEESYICKSCSGLMQILQIKGRD